jgi:nitrogen fixation protein NifX
MLKRQLRVVGPDVSTALKVAFATTDMKSVNQHFGSSMSFAVYAVEPDEAQLLEVAQFGRLAQDGNEDKLAAKITTLAGCSAVYSQACGASAVRQLIAKGIQPVRVEPDTRISALIEALQQEMRAGPSAWLAKAIRQQQGGDMGRFDAMEEEGWSE